MKEQWIDREQAGPGDVVVVHGHHSGEPQQLGEILEVVGAGARIHFRVRWGDGRESVFFPGEDATIRHPHRPG